MLAVAWGRQLQLLNMVPRKASGGGGGGGRDDGSDVWLKPVAAYESELEIGALAWLPEGFLLAIECAGALGTRQPHGHVGSPQSARRTGAQCSAERTSSQS